VTNNHSGPFEDPVVEQSATTSAPAFDQFGVVPPAPPQPVAIQLDPDNPPWAEPRWLGGVKAFLIWVGSVACLLFVPLILVVPYMVYRVATSGQAVLANIANDKMFLFLSVLGVIPAHALTLFIAYLVVTGRRSYPFLKTLGFSWPARWGTLKGMVICTLIGAGLFAGGAVITQVFPGEKTQLDMLIESSFAARAATAFLAVATAPLVEELIYRGMHYPAIARVLGSGVSIGIVSILFAGVHFLQYQNNLAVIGVITLVSITLTTVRAYTRRLLPCFVIHMIFNGIQAVIFLLYPFLTKAQEQSPQPAPAEFVAGLIKHLF
jgi:membrane protease YdiL (CAAX protease family)